VNELIRTALGADGVLVATIDMPDRTMNVLMDRVDNDAAVQSCVITSGKPSFLAGADLVMVRGYCDAAATSTHAQMFEMCGRLGRQFVRLESSAKPWVAAVNGLALGGGLELALACRVRIVADDSRLQLGVPEVRWGLLPGAGGTQRLPRLAGFEPAMDMLLSGRSITPADAVRLGIFAAAVPATKLLDDAQTIARALHGKPYDEREKFHHLAQGDVPAHSDATARAVAAKNGVSVETFDLYPAYSAIIDSVLKGARLPLADATALEMDQFLRLMFSPIAGCMVRTLFLERLRAERELAAPADMKLERLAFGALGTAWAEALAKVKLPQAADTTLPADTLELFDVQGGRRRVTVRALGDDGSGPGAVLAPAGPYGRVMEIVGGDDSQAAALAALAGRMGTLVWRTPGPMSVLQQLRGLSLEHQVPIAAASAGAPGAGDPAFLDVAACLAGVAPAWSGGPLTWQRTQGA
jgi:3-hydroxyacyl-CoA dehydrogenase/enoyl-CoA hydratase/3-hydroxybutyryl-CoA epimerase